MSSAQENINAVRSLCEIVNSRDYDAMDKLFAPSFVDQNPAWSVTSLDDLKKIIIAAHTALDMMIIQDNIFASGEYVVVQITFHGKHVGTFFDIPPTGKQVSWSSIEIYRFEKGKIVERWVQADTTGLMRQLGVDLPK